MNASNNAARLSTQLNQLEQASLIRLATVVADLEYVFRHALIQDSVYQTLVRADRRRVHRAAGETMEALLAGREPPPELASQLARHFDEAGDPSRALRYYTLAADAALAGYANAEAIALYTRALAAAERSSADAERSAAPPVAGPWQHLFEARGRALELNSQYPLALANYQAMTQRAEALGDRRLALAAAVAIGQLYATATALMDLPRAEQAAAANLAEARALGDEAAESKILWNLLNLYRHTERNPRAREAGEQSLAIARRLNLTNQAALTLNDLVHIYAALGLWPELARASVEAQGLWRALGNVALLADSLSTAALYQGMVGELEPALSQAREAHQHVVAIGNLWGQTYSLLIMYWPYWCLGQPGRALETARECLRVSETGWPAAANVVTAGLAVMLAELGDAAGGLALIQQAGKLTAFLSGAAVGQDMLLLAARVQVEVRSGALEPALATLAAMEQEPGARQPMLWFIQYVLRARSGAALAQGDAARALAVTQAEVAELRQRGLLTFLPEALTGLAQALLRQGRVPEARDRLLEALALAQAMKATMFEWTVRYALGRLEIEHGDPASAAPHWAAAREIVTVIAARLPTAELRRSFLARPEPRALLGNPAFLAIDSGQSPAGRTSVSGDT